MEELKRIWGKVLEDLAEEISAVSFDSWIKPIEAVSMDDTRITLKVPFSVNKNMIMTKYFSLIESNNPFSRALSERLLRKACLRRFAPSCRKQLS